jgi:hypothetical protein
MGRAMTEVLLTYRGLGEDLPFGVFSKACHPTPEGAWAWLHTLRTGELFQNEDDLHRWATEERKLYLKNLARKPLKPKLVPYNEAPLIA